MDQLKTFLRQCVKYRFWIAVGVSILLPMIGTFVGTAPIVEATAKKTNEIKGADTDVGKYTGGSQPVPEVTRLVAEKKEALAKDVDATQRELYAMQEPLLRWPEVVEDKFRAWGRKWPENTDPGAVQQTINDYFIAYPNFIDQVYRRFKPWNPEDGQGIVYAPEKEALIKPAAFTLTSAPDLGKVWAEQERLWVVTALLDVVAKVNDQAGAKDWDGAWIKEIVDVTVGSLASQDQVSLAKGEALEAAPPLLPDGAAPPEDPAAAAGAAGAPGGMGMMYSGGGMGGAAAKTDEVYFLKSEKPLPYKVLPITMTVRVDQDRIAEFMVGLENSPMAIEVMEPEISKPSTPVVKPIYGETTGFGAGMMMGGGGRGGMNMGYGSEMMSGSGGMRSNGMPGGGPMGGGMMGSSGMMSGYANMSGGRGGMGSGGAPKQGTDLRGQNKAEERKAKAKEAAKKKAATPKKSVDQYYNVVEVTVYGRARFYNTPAPTPPADPSASAGATPAEPGTATPAATPAAPGAPTAPAATPKADEPAPPR